MLGSYRVLLQKPGAPWFSISGFVARLPMSMVVLGIVILVSDRTGSYGLAGSVSAAYVVARAVCTPLQARVVDRYGQSRILPFIAVTHATALGGLIVVLESEQPVVIAHLLAALGGASSPTISAYVRARWRHVLGEGPELQTAFSFEAVAEEFLFIVGPPLVTFLATTVSSIAGLLTAAVCGLVGTLWLAQLRESAPPPSHTDGTGRGPAPPLGWSVMLPLVVACVGVGGLFGSFDISVIALATEHHARAWAGVLLGTCATGSMLAGILVGSLRSRPSVSLQFRLGTAAMACAMIPLPFVDNLWLLGVLVFGVGFTIAPTLIASSSLAVQIVPSTRVSEGLAWTSSAVVGGIAGGGAVAGRIIDSFGASTGFLFALAGGAFAALVANLGRIRKPRRVAETAVPSTQ